MTTTPSRLNFPGFWKKLRPSSPANFRGHTALRDQQIQLHKVIVWDAATRLFHWLTVLLVIACYASWRMNFMDWHAWTGEALLALVLFRLLWAFFGSETARFSAFLSAPRAAAHYLTCLLRRAPDRWVGHNPVGGWMVLLLLALLLVEALTGLYVANDVADEGPFTETVPPFIANLITDLHAYFWDALLLAMILHVLAIALYAAVLRHNLVTPMITGCKWLSTETKPPQLASAARAAFLFGCSALAAAALATYL
jgi:cytochrome b